MGLGACTLAGPVLAVQAQKWIERARERRNRKAALFQVLMATRANRVSSQHVEALNMIDLTFDGARRIGPKRTKREQAVLRAWREYLDHLNDHPPDENTSEAVGLQWGTRVNELFLNLLRAIAADVDYEFV